VSWYKITLPLSECGIGGTAKSLQTAFETLFMANSIPKDAAMFARNAEDSEHCHYFFSPGALAIAASLIEGFGGTKCDPPAGNDLHLLVGHASARQTLLAKKGGS
jgi:hypothetical protein